MGIVPTTLQLDATIVIRARNNTGTGNKNLDFTGKKIKLIGVAGAANCIIDRQNSGRGFYFHTGETAESVVDGFTIRNGNVSSSSPGSAYGGGIWCNSASPTLTNCTISGNTVNGTTFCGGGGIYCPFSSSTLTNCTISGNTVNGTTYPCGGGICGYVTSATLVNCTISGNWAKGGYRPMGGGVYCFSSSAVFTNCTISGNWTWAVDSLTHAWGGGVYCTSSNPTLTNCTIVANNAASGGGISWNSSSPIITNCILWCDTPQEIYISSGTGVVSYSDIQGGFGGTANINANPLFVDPAGPDGDPNTPADNNYRLAAGSPCIDTGTNTPPGGLPSYDADGIPRPQDGDGDGQVTADMGAYEYPPAADFNEDGAVDATDYWYLHDGLGRCAPQQAYQDHILADMDHDGCITLADYQIWVIGYRAATGMDFVPPRLRRAGPAGVTGVSTTHGQDIRPLVDEPSGG